MPEAADLRRRLPPARCRRPTRGPGELHRGGRNGPGRALRGVSRIQRGRPAPAHRHFGSATSRTRETDATTHPEPPEERQPSRALVCLLTTEGSRYDCPSHISDACLLSCRGQQFELTTTRRPTPDRRNGQTGQPSVARARNRTTVASPAMPMETKVTTRAVDAMSCRPTAREQSRLAILASAVAPTSHAQALLHEAPLTSPKAA